MIVKNKMLLRERVEGLKRQRCDQQSDAHGDGGGDQRFAQQLRDQLKPNGANGFSNPDLFCPPDAAHGGQVCKVDAGNGQNEDGQHGKDDGILLVSLPGRFHGIGDVIPMDGGQRLKTERTFEPGGMGIGIQATDHERLQTALDFRNVAGVFKLHIVIRSEITPNGHPR